MIVRDMVVRDGKCYDREAYQQGKADGRADAIDDAIKAIDEQNYCMQEECPFNACRSEGCPVNRNAEVIFQTWLKKVKEQKNV